MLILGLAALVGWGGTGGLTLVFTRLAAQALAARDTDAAARWLAWSQRFSQTDARAEYVRARVARHRQDYGAVRSHLRRAFELDFPRELLEREQWLAMAQAGQLREAEPHLPALLNDPRDDGAEICEAYVNGYLLTYQPAKANLLLGGWERDFPEDPLPHVIRGGLHASALQWKDAERSYREALARDSGNSEAAVGLADVLVALNQYQPALDWYRKGQTAVLQNLKARLGAARCLEALGRLDEARQALTALEREHPGSSPVLFALAQLELGARNDARARELLERALRIDPHNSGVRLALAGVLRRAGELDEAETLSREAREMAAAKTRAEELLEKVAARPQDVAVRFELGKLQLRYGSEREGVLWLKSVLEFQPDHAGAREALERYERDKKRTVAE